MGLGRQDVGDLQIGIGGLVVVDNGLWHIECVLVVVIERGRTHIRWCQCIERDGILVAEWDATGNGAWQYKMLQRSGRIVIAIVTIDLILLTIVGDKSGNLYRLVSAIDL